MFDNVHSDRLRFVLLSIAQLGMWDHRKFRGKNQSMHIIEAHTIERTKNIYNSKNNDVLKGLWIIGSAKYFGEHPIASSTINEINYHEQ